MNRSPALFTGLFLLGALSFLRPSSSQEPAQVPSPVEVPIGGIILWWGRASEIPDGFEPCDGQSVTTRDAVLRGTKPNLQNKFPRGAADYRTFVPQAYAGGGSDTIVLDENSLKLDAHKFTLKETQLPAHDHEFGPLEHTGLFNHSHAIAAHSHGMDHLHNVADHTHGGVPTASVNSVSVGAGALAAYLPRRSGRPELRSARGRSRR